MNYDVIRLTTSTGTYIANGILTHNSKPASPRCGIDYSKTESSTFSCQLTFDAGYTAVYPFSCTVTAEVYSGGNCSDIYVIPSSFTISSGTTKTNITVTRKAGWTDSGATTGYWRSYLTATDANGKQAINNGSSLKSGTIVPLSCLTPDSLIEMFNGSTALLSDIKIGDSLRTINTKTMEYEEATVTAKSEGISSSIYKINNGLLKSSDSHMHIVKRGGRYNQVVATELVVGDTFLDRDFNEVTISKIDILN